MGNLIVSKSVYHTSQELEIIYLPGGASCLEKGGELEEGELAVGRVVMIPQIAYSFQHFTLQ